VKKLNRSEAAVLHSLLACSMASQRSQIEGSGLPKTTYQDAKRRLYAEGIVADRYVPYPPLVGVETIRFEVAQPFAEEMPAAARAWEADPASVLVFAGGQTLVGVFFEEGRPKRKPSRSGGTRPTPSPGREFSVSVSSSAYGVPVYFDFEGALSHVLGAPPTGGYPRGLGGPWPDRATAGIRWDPRQRPELVAQLLRRPLEVPAGNRPSHLLGPVSLPRSLRQLAGSAFFSWRTFPSLSSLPSFRDRGVRSLAFVHGLLHPGARPSELFASLVALLGIHPFLLATDGERVILGTCLGEVAPSGAGARGAEGGPSTLHVLRSYLRQIDLIREPVESLRVLVDHRYDRLSPVAPPQPSVLALPNRHGNASLPFAPSEG
jgi:hypothetical protein